MKKISLKGLADYMTANPHKQRTILREFKYPKEDEASARTLYYKSARDMVRLYHKKSLAPASLLTKAATFRADAVGRSPSARTKLLHNARALEEYARNFGDRKFDIQPRLAMELQYDDVVVTVFPDLNAMEAGTQKVIKLEFGAKPPSPEMIQIISQGMFEAVKNEGLGLPSKDILYIDVARASVHKSARMGARMATHIEAACQNISAIWDKI